MIKAYIEKGQMQIITEGNTNTIIINLIELILAIHDNLCIYEKEKFKKGLLSALNKLNWEEAYKVIKK